MSSAVCFFTMQRVSSLSKCNFRHKQVSSVLRIDFLVSLSDSHDEDMKILILKSKRRVSRKFHVYKFDEVENFQFSISRSMGN